MNWSYLPNESSWRIRLLVWGGVVLLHVLFYKAIKHCSAPLGVSSIGIESRTQVFTVSRRNDSLASSVSGEQAAKTDVSKMRIPNREGRAFAEALEKKEAVPLIGAVPSKDEGPVRDGPLMLDWTVGGETAQDFQRNIMTDDVPASFVGAEPGRFRMRRQMSGKDVIEGAAQLLGFWPPGYTTDPCPQIKRNIGKLTNDPRSADRELLDEELRRQQAFCR